MNHKDLETLQHIWVYKKATDMVRNGDLVCDIGCGIGYGAKILAEKGIARAVYALDLNILQQTKKFQSKRLKYIQSDAQNLPFADDSFDLITCLMTINQVNSPRMVLAEIARVLKQDGSLIISTPNRIIYAPLKKKPENPFCRYHWSVDEFQNLLEEYFIVQCRGQMLFHYNLFTACLLYLKHRLGDLIVVSKKSGIDGFGSIQFGIFEYLGLRGLHYSQGISGKCIPENYEILPLKQNSTPYTIVCQARLKNR